MGSVNQVESSLVIDNEERIILLVKNDKNKFPLIYDKYVDCVYKYFLSRVQNQEIAEDLTSDLFIAVLNNLDRYKHSGHFRAWVFTIARNMFYKHLRVPCPSNIEDFDNLPSHMPLPEQEATDKQMLQKVRNFIRIQPDLDQEILRLRFVSGLKFSEISMVIGKSETATKKYFYRLLEKISSFVECEK